ncbi:DUF2786 domain-containing protein [Roseobacter phage CRP-738]|nr:DUF2786 domain-containing protein [Roseobacter phage CRP-738]
MSEQTRKAVIKKLRAFAQRTVENGCTEAEAIAAAEAMQKLQHEYNMTLTDADILDAEYVTEKMQLGNQRMHPVVGCVMGVAIFTSTKMYKSGATLYIFGEKHKVDNAIYLISTIQSAMELEFLNYRGTEAYLRETWYHHGQTIRSSFMNGMAHRLYHRLLQMHKELMEQDVTVSQTTGNSLVVMSDKALDEAFRRQNPNLRSGRRQTTSRSANASAAGRSAADRVGLRSGVRAGSAQRAIG